jgi:hypothetical protein
MLIRLWITLFLINNPLLHKGDKKGIKGSFVDKKCPKKGVIHNISTKCGYMESNNVEMWISGIPPISCEKKF